MLFAFIDGLSGNTSALLIFCVVAVCFFEAINGFHDTANAVATVIYTLKPFPLSPPLSGRVAGISSALFSAVPQ
jgi:phosphate/sulfate permease